MKNNIPKWVRDKGQIIQEISQDISWYSGKLVEKAKKTDLGADLVKKYRSEAPQQKTETQPMMYSPDPWEEEQELLEKLDWAIRRAYCKEGGYYYYGCNLVRYANAAMLAQEDLQTVWSAGYNSCIQPMLRQLEKLENEMDELLPPADRAHLELKHADLLEKMQAFRQLAYDWKLHSRMDLEPEAYRQALYRYAGELEEQLLTPFRHLTEQ